MLVDWLPLPRLRLSKRSAASSSSFLARPSWYLHNILEQACKGFITLPPGARRIKVFPFSGVSAGGCCHQRSMYRILDRNLCLASMGGHRGGSSM